MMGRLLLDGASRRPHGARLRFARDVRLACCTGEMARLYARAEGKREGSAC